jgi:hypothetical protein
MITFKGREVKGNVQPSSSSKAKDLLDFRFADDEDAEDIEFLMSVSYRDEYDVNSSTYNRKEFGCAVEHASKVEIEMDCNKGDIRWIVLETPVPDEQIVAAARIQLDNNDAGRRIANIKTFGYVEDTLKSSTKSQLVVQIERTLRSLGISLLSFEVSQHRVDIQTWLEECGYKDNGGYMSTHTNYVKPTMMLLYQKDLSANLSTVSASKATTTTTTTTDNVFHITGNMATLDLGDGEIPGLPSLEDQEGSFEGGKEGQGLVFESLSLDALNSTDMKQQMKAAHGSLPIAMGELFTALHKESAQNNADPKK